MDKSDSNDGPKYNPDTSHWNSTDNNVDDTEPLPRAEIDTHYIRILQYRDGKQDLEWCFSVRQGEVVGVTSGHRLGDSNQFDPMEAGWEDVPSMVKDELAKTLAVTRGDLEHRANTDRPGMHKHPFREE